MSLHRVLTGDKRLCLSSRRRGIMHRSLQPDLLLSSSPLSSSPPCAPFSLSNRRNSLNPSIPTSPKPVSLLQIPPYLSLSFCRSLYLINYFSQSVCHLLLFFHTPAGLPLYLSVAFCPCASSPTGPRGILEVPCLLGGCEGAADTLVSLPSPDPPLKHTPASP